MRMKMSLQGESAQLIEGFREQERTHRFRKGYRGSRRDTGSTVFITMATMFRMVARRSVPLFTMGRRGYADKMSFTFASPYEVFYSNAEVKQVDVPSYSGSFGILANHVPSLAVIKPGVVTVIENDVSSKKYFVSSGTITINEDSSVQVLAEEAVPVEWLDVTAARNVLSEAQAALGRASSEEEKAEAQISVEVGEALVKAAE